MKKRLLLFVSVFTFTFSLSQKKNTIKPLSELNVKISDSINFINHFVQKIKDKKRKNFHTSDIYNPINFTKITERMPANNGKASSYTVLNRSSLEYINRGSEIHLEFDKDFVYHLTQNKMLDLRVVAYIVRKDNTIKPLQVNGFTNIEAYFGNQEQFKKGLNEKEIQQEEDDKEEKENINYQVNQSYKVDFLKSKKESFSGEVVLVWEEISVDDKIVITILNKKLNNVGFSTTLVFDDFGWQQQQTGGLSFIQTPTIGSEFVPAGTIGYSFRYKPRRSKSFRAHFFLPGFGPELNVYQTNNVTNVGLGGFITTAYDVVKISAGVNINGENSGKFYYGIGLNFVKTFNVVTGLLNNTK